MEEAPGHSASQKEYVTPPISELRRLLSTARDKARLSHLGITHIVNAADGPRRINTGPQFYSDMTVDYHGVEAADHPDFNLSPFFYPTAEFIQTALSKKGKRNRVQ
ncbi:hypothetical protein JZ751_019885 [Albula glossodonta]|uniref:Dual specificity protein phosphatase n=1 Tax=Albula glossodonta TaxID=121402 RepID=A0A8T2NPX6_9TELE|nr:hypothetical protein JZ751_019885 [Albula glossodonta]